jgi:hypothetical protein
MASHQLPPVVTVDVSVVDAVVVVVKLCVTSVVEVVVVQADSREVPIKTIHSR